MKIWLIDTAPIVAYLDSTDPYHERVSSRLEEFDGGLASTSAVVTETMHFVAPARSGPQRLAEFISASPLYQNKLDKAELAETLLSA